MPMTFTDEMVAERVRHYKLSVQPGETERDALAKHSEDSGDFVEAQEIRTGRGWDEWTREDKVDLLSRKGFLRRDK